MIYCSKVCEKTVLKTLSSTCRKEKKRRAHILYISALLSSTNKTVQIREGRTVHKKALFLWSGGSVDDNRNKWETSRAVSWNWFSLSTFSSPESLSTVVSQTLKSVRNSSSAFVPARNLVNSKKVQHPHSYIDRSFRNAYLTCVVWL